MEVKVFMKHNDMTCISFDTYYHDSDYLPYIGPFYSDESTFVIDNETGVIKNWKPLAVVDGKLVERK